MYYELYVDVFFLVNFMMDYLLLLLLRKMLSCSATHERICLGAVTGSLLTCLILLSPISNTILKFILFHIVVNGLMIRIGLKIKNTKSFVKAYFLLYIGSFLLGGVFQALNQYIRVGSLFFAIAIGGYCLVSKIWDYIKAVQRIQQYQCKVELHFKEKRYCIKGIIDTGNGLYDPISNQPVSILDRRAARDFLGNEKMTQIKYIPYHSIGKQEGVLMAVKIDKMYIYGEKEYFIKEPLIGISNETISAEDDYQMILHPNLF